VKEEATQARGDQQGSQAEPGRPLAVIHPAYRRSEGNTNRGEGEARPGIGGLLEPPAANCLAVAQLDERDNVHGGSVATRRSTTRALPGHGE